jgi:hypothetical protein
MVQEIDVKPYELVDGSKCFGGLRVGVIRAKGPVLSNDINGFLYVGRPSGQFRQIVLPVVGPHGVSPGLEGEEGRAVGPRRVSKLCHSADSPQEGSVFSERPVGGEL